MHHAMKMYGGVEVWLHTFLNLALGGDIYTFENLFKLVKLRKHHAENILSFIGIIQGKYQFLFAKQNLMTLFHVTLTLNLYLYSFYQKNNFS
jgi:hypothetical protein